MRVRDVPEPAARITGMQAGRGTDSPARLLCMQLSETFTAMLQPRAEPCASRACFTRSGMRGLVGRRLWYRSATNLIEATTSLRC